MSTGEIILCMTLAMLVGGCLPGDGPPLARRGRALYGDAAEANDRGTTDHTVLADGTPDAASGDDAQDGRVDAFRYVVGGPCGMIPIEGCCDNETLWWCKEGALVTQSCAVNRYCGWNDTAQINDCNTAGAQDPTGRRSKDCYLIGPWPDAGLTDGTVSACGRITREGCCAGRTLKYCDEGRLVVIDCALNQKCGWRLGGRLYDCGTDGLPDPEGKNPMACSGPGHDGGGDATPFEAGPGDTGNVDGGDHGVTNPGCQCALREEVAGGGWPLLLLGVLLVVVRRGPGRKNGPRQPSK